MQLKYLILIISMYILGGLGCWILCKIADRLTRSNYEKLSDQGKKLQKRLDRGR